MNSHLNSVFSVVLPFCSSLTENITPESVIFGYTKLLLLNESILTQLVPEDRIAELDDVRKEFENSKLDLNLIRSGLAVFKRFLRSSDQCKEKSDAFNAFLDNLPENTSSAEIVKKAIEMATIPLYPYFTAEGSINDIYALNKKMNETLDTNPDNKTSSDHSSPATDAVPETKKEEIRKETIEHKTDFKEFADQYRKITGSILNVVKGQDQAVTRFVQGYFQGELLKDSEKNTGPRSHFFFFGPSGVGKSLLAETAAKAIGLPYKVFDMSEYCYNGALEELLSSKGSFDTSSGNSIPGFVRANPKCVLIFDNFDKASRSLIQHFVQMLNTGVTYSFMPKKSVSLKDTIIIFTSDAGKSLYEEKKNNLSQLPLNFLVDVLTEEKDKYDQPLYPQELLLNIASGNTIIFNHLSARVLIEMVEDSFNSVIQQMEDEYDCQLTYSSALPLLFIYSYGRNLNARIADTQSNVFIKNEILEMIRQLDSERAGSQKIKKISFDVDTSSSPKEIQNLFDMHTKTEILFFSDKSVSEIFAVTESCKVHTANNIQQAEKILLKDINAVFIDPLFRSKTDNSGILSITDFNTEGIDLFHKITDQYEEIPVFILNKDGTLTNVDQLSFLMEGAANTISFNSSHPETFRQQVLHLIEDLCTENDNASFVQKGWVIDYKSRQNLSDNGEVMNVILYDLKKRQAVDGESRRSILSSTERPKTKFSDVIGASNAKQELQYFISYLKNPKQFMANGTAKPPKGVLLYGPPGTGKTMLARAMAGESDVTFIQTSAAEFKNKYVGESESNIRKLFSKARQYAPSIIFIDEIDAIGKERTGEDPVTESMLNTLLTEMDGFTENTKKPVFVLAATNYGITSDRDSIAALDSALLRRFDNRIKVDLPNYNERLEYLETQLSKLKISVSEEICKNIAERTTGQSLAILNHIIDLARRNSVSKKEAVTDYSLLESLEEYLYGEKTEFTEDYYKAVAIHETGHAYVSYLTGNAPSYITIESRGDFGGYMQPGNSEHVPIYTRSQLVDMICVSLAGKAAEQIFFGKEKANNTGASSDLKKATDIAFHIISMYSMEDNQLAVLSRDEIMKSSLAADYIKQVNQLLQQQMNRTIQIIEEHKQIIEKLADVLLKENYLTGLQFSEYINLFSRESE